MIALRRPLLSLASLAAFLVVPVSGQDAQETFNQGVELLSRGQKEEAIAAFQKVLAMDLSHEEAYELWQSAGHDVFTRLLAEGGQVELMAMRFSELSSLGRSAKSRDEDAIRAKLADVTSDDVMVRTKAVQALSAAHGEFAVPYMVFSLGDQADEDRRVLTMQALTRMGDDVVLPLVAALESPEAYMRRNVALTLGYIGDPRANAALAMHAFGDEDPPVRTAASQALERCGGSSDVAGQFLALGNAYYAQSDTVLMPHMVSEVVWSWDGSGLSATDTPSYLYAPELAKRAYGMALEADPTSQAAVAGLARCVVTQRERLAGAMARGEDGGDWEMVVQSDSIALQLAGADALDLALGWALDQDDQIAASGLCQALEECASAPTANLARALSAGSSGAVRGEAAVALAKLQGASAGSDTIQALTEAAARRVLRIAAVIDGDDVRRNAVADALRSRGMMVNAWPTGGRGLGAIRSVPGIDIVLVAEQLPDLTMNQVVTALKQDPRTSGAPVLVLAADAESDHGEAVAGVVTGPGDAEAIEAAISQGLNEDRQQANELSARAAGALWGLAWLGSDLSGSAPALASTLDGRPDEVALPALGTLGLAGGAGEIGAVTAVLSDASRSEEVRIAAAKALGEIFSRTGNADEAVLQAVSGVARSDESLAVRTASARALGRLQLSAEMRAELIRGVSGQ